MKPDKLLVVHGGPGIPSHYLKEPLKKYKYVEFLFYDQSSVPRQSSPSQRLDLLVQELCTEFEEATESGNVGILAHSWGTFLLLEGMKRYTALFEKSVTNVLVSPFPLNFERVGGTVARLQSRIPENVRAEIEEDTRLGRDDRIMGRYAPYYFKNQELAKCLEFKQYSIEQNQLVWESAVGIDHTDVATVNAERIFTMLGDSDFITNEDIQELGNIHLISDCGHYPFIEAAATFGNLLSKAINDSTVVISGLN